MMKEKLKNFIDNIKLRRIRALVILACIILVVVATGVSASYLVSKKDSADVANDESTDNNTGEINSIVSVVGNEDSSIIGNTKSNNSWSGEIISLNNLQVQPDREGTISEWYVRIGERVNAGQVMGRLSRPPQTPEMVNMLSEKSQMLSESRTNLEATRTYTEKRILQLKQLRQDTESSNKQKIDLLRQDTLGSDDALLSLIASKKKLTQVILRRSITKIFPVIYDQTNVLLLELNNFSLQLNYGFGAFNSKLRHDFTPVILGAWSDLKDINTLPEKSGLLYFDTATKLANSSITGDTLSEVSLESIKQMLIQDQSEFITTLGEIKSMELERVNVQRESIDTLAEIDAMITELEKELAMSEGDVIAKEATYKSIRSSITLGYSIIAPNSGVVSSIMKKPGEFVGPGMPVATVTAKGNDRVLVRMSMPNNIQKPEVGEVLSIIRPGFGTDVQKVRLVGIGSSLDDGSYMADAVFTEETKWPIGASVRVLAPKSSSPISIKHSSVFWSEGGAPTIWAISEADRIFAKKITIGRTLGTLIEVYTGLENGDRYIADSTLDIKEGMFLGDLIKTSTPNQNDSSVPAKPGEDKDMGGMEM